MTTEFVRPEPVDPMNETVDVRFGFNTNVFVTKNVNKIVFSDKDGKTATCLIRKGDFAELDINCLDQDDLTNLQTALQVATRYWFSLETQRKGYEVVTREQRRDREMSRGRLIKAKLLAGDN